MFVKCYGDPARAAARTHLTWLTCLNTGIRLPALSEGVGCEVILEHLDARSAGPADLDPIAASLGRLHGVAHGRELHAADLDRDFVTATGLIV